VNDLLGELRGALASEGLEAGFTLTDLVVAVLVSFVLATAIGLTYRWTHRGSPQVQSFVQTLAIMSMVTAVTIMVVGGSVARAFAVFGAFSMIRFRNALPETRDVGFLFFAMVVGMASGARRPDMALAATVLICCIVLATSRLRLFGAGRTSQLLRVRMTNDLDHVKVLHEPLERHADDFQLLSVESVQAGMLTEVTYSIALRAPSDAHDLVAAIRERNGNNRVLLLAHAPEPGLTER
jgi:hypothetical protein